MKKNYNYKITIKVWLNFLFQILIVDKSAFFQYIFMKITILCIIVFFYLQNSSNIENKIYFSNYGLTITIFNYVLTYVSNKD